MKIKNIRIQNFRSIADADIEFSNYTLLVGANNAGKSNFLAAIRAFYDDVKWNVSDFPIFEERDTEAWIEITYTLGELEWDTLADKYKAGITDRSLKLRRYFKSDTLVKSGQSNIYGYVNGEIERELFYGAKNVASGKLGQVIYVPAMTTPDDQTKLSGPSPLRDVLNFLLRKIVTGNPAYEAIERAFENLNATAKADDGFLSEVSGPLNAAIADWMISFDLQVNSIKPEEISKNLISFSFRDKSLGNVGFDLSKYGHGFQRTVIYELIRLAPTFKERKLSEKKEFSPDLTLILFEEPEAFLHPTQQENMAYHLRRLSAEENQQVILNTHSSVFAGKAAADIGQIVRLTRKDGRSHCHQASGDALADIFNRGGLLLTALQAFVADQTVPENQKGNARKFIENPPNPIVRESEERFRFQLWLDSERSAMFFADRVLLVEGASEKALFNFLLADEWRHLVQHRICVIDVLGKFNMHRYMSLMMALGIPYGVIIDDDNQRHHQQAVNDLVDQISRDANSTILAAPVKVPDCIEAFLGLPKVKDRDDKKPLELLKALTNGTIEPRKLSDLQDIFKSALALP